MKTKITNRLALAFISLILISIGASAIENEDGVQIYYRWIGDVTGDKRYEVTNYNKSDEPIVYEEEKKYKGEVNIPDLYKFLVKYKNDLNDDFVLGYYVHLYTDYLWFKYFVPQLYDEDTCMITKLDGTEVKCNGGMMAQYIYNDYTNLNTQLLDEYDMDLRIFYNELPEIKNIIEEIPIDRLNILMDKCSTIIENAKESKDMVFNMNYIKQFIEMSLKIIESDLEERGIK